MRNKRELNVDETEMYVLIRYIPQEKAQMLFEHLQKLTGGWVLKAIEKRFNAYELEVDKKIMIMILLHGNGAVGRCAQYVDDIAKWANEKNKKIITIENYENDIYPAGIPIF